MFYNIIQLCYVVNLIKSHDLKLETMHIPCDHSETWQTQTQSAGEGSQVSQARNMDTR